MPDIRHQNRSVIFAASFILIASAAAAQEPELVVTVQKLVERGALEEAVQRAQGEQGNPEAAFFAAQALMKMNNNEGAANQYEQLQQTGDASWQAIGESGAKLAAGDLEGAMAAASRAVEVNEGNPFAHYQVATVASRQNNFEQAANEFARAVELKPDFAYAHYYAGLAAQRLKQIARMSEHFEAFMRLAPDAPERNAVAAVLRTLRPRRN